MLSSDVRTHVPHGAFVPGVQIALLEQDELDHSRHRRLVSAAFASRAVRDLEPRTVEITRSLVGGLGDSGTTDFVASCTYPMPLEVICELFGVPATDRKPFREWAVNLSAAPSVAAMQPAAAEPFEYCMGLIRSKRAEPTPDLLGELIEARFEDDSAPSSGSRTVCSSWSRIHRRSWRTGSGSPNTRVRCRRSRFGSRGLALEVVGSRPGRPEEAAQHVLT